MAKGLPGSVIGQGSFFEVREDRTVKLRPEEMNGRYATAPPPVAAGNFSKTRRSLRPKFQPAIHSALTVAG